MGRFTQRQSEYDVALDKASVPFVYPEDESPTIQLSDNVSETLKRFALALLKAKDIRRRLIAILYLSGFDVAALIGAKANDAKSLAQFFGISPRGMGRYLIRTARDYGIDWHRATGNPKQKRKRKVV
jgi:hypothetical protein